MIKNVAPKLIKFVILVTQKTSSFTTIGFVGATVISILLILIVIGVVYFIRTSHRKRGMHQHLKPQDDSIEAPDHPILSKGVSLKHMIEMTTSGSGSGKNSDI